MAKRSAAKQLTQDNFDKSDSEEDDVVGTPVKASEEVLKNRVIKTGKRRLVAGDDQGGKNIFAGFQGFGTSSTESTDKKTKLSLFSSTPIPKPISEVENNQKADTSETADTDGVFLGQVKKLNDQFLKFAQKEYDRLNGVCDFTPCMKNYNLHMKKILKDRDEGKEKEKTATAVFKFGSEAPKTTDTPATKSSFAAFSFKASTEKPPATVTQSHTTSTFSFGSPSAVPANSTSSPDSSAGKSTEFKFTFSMPPTTDKPVTTGPTSTVNPLFGQTSAFSFGLPKPSTNATFSFGLSSGSVPVSTAAPGYFAVNSSQSTGEDGKKDGEEETEEEKEQQEYEKKDVKETDAFFEARTKLFYLAGKEFKSRGVGNLFLKNVGEKVQMIVRADNSLGNLLLNVFVKNVNPKLEQNKKSVSMWCIPNPPIDPKSSEAPKPTKFLFNLKDESIANTLVEHLEKNN